MDLTLDDSVCQGYKSPLQRSRVLTENWVKSRAYCPNCGLATLTQYRNNRPVADFSCSGCGEDFELKSSKTAIRSRIVDGAHRTMLERLDSNTNPNLFLLAYDAARLKVTDFLVVPKHFFVPSIIERRNPLSASARRAGWTGCYILLSQLPDAGKISLVRDSEVVPKANALSEWQRTLFLRHRPSSTTRGWILDVIHCIENLGKHDFRLEEIYSFESELRDRHPMNFNIRPKIRQQLQYLRDQGYLQFISPGRYKLSGQSRVSRIAAK